MAGPALGKNEGGSVIPKEKMGVVEPYGWLRPPQALFFFFFFVLWSLGVVRPPQKPPMYSSTREMEFDLWPKGGLATPRAREREREKKMVWPLGVAKPPYFGQGGGSATPNDFSNIYIYIYIYI